MRKKAIEKQEKDWACLLNMLAKNGTLTYREMERKRR